MRGLKIRHNNVLGYFVEVTAQHGDKLMAAPLNATFIHRQTLAGQVRFTTTELAELEAKIASAADRALAWSWRFSTGSPAQVVAARRSDQSAPRRRWRCSMCRRAGDARGRARLRAPEVGRALDFVIEGGRHPVVEQALLRDGGPFIANDCDLSPPAGDGGRPNLAASPARTWRASRPSCARTR